MKKVFTPIVFLLACKTVSAQAVTKETSAINAQVDAMLHSWNSHNYDDLKNYTTENTDWVNGVGMWWKGRKESQYAHQAYHNTMFKESVVTKDSVFIRFVTPDVAIAHLYWHFSDFIDPSGKAHKPDNCIATVVYVKQNGTWLMTAGENLGIVDEALPSDPIRHMPKN